MSEKNRVAVRIAGNEYVISGDESPEYIQRIAMYVDRKLQEITRKNHLLSTSMAAVLASVNLADEMFRLTEALNKSDFELKDLKKKAQELRDENQRLKADCARLKERELQLRTDLAQREAEIREMRNTLNALSNNKKERE